ncbi:hypothetical protein LOZ80_08940 [Paenibacillus sp. HWE-109]|uniref:hypothetical protein n=1 Tax=Paenibacillus TaxID=44249 RepID=UPI00166D6772|nr:MULTISPECIES: hypothetical protein [Paenibacillus]UKS29034.1 hypothetical protein LOZ80_08940 [Paenibacillus sp. HWE-109]
MERTLKSTKCIPHHKRHTIREIAHKNVGRIVVVQSLAGTFTGCIVSAHNTFLRLRVFNPVIGRFVIIRIPFAIIIRIRLFPCKSCN